MLRSDFLCAILTTTPQGRCFSAVKNSLSYELNWSLPNSQVEAQHLPPPMWLYLETRPVRIQLKLNEVKEWVPSPIGLMSLQKEEETPGTHGDEATWGHKDTAICMPRTAVSAESSPGNTLILDVPSPDWENTFLLLKLPSVWCFAMATKQTSTLPLKRLLRGNWCIINCTDLSAQFDGYRQLKAPR